MKEWVLTPDRFLSKEELGKLLKRAEELRSLGVDDHSAGIALGPSSERGLFPQSD